MNSAAVPDDRTRTAALEQLRRLLVAAIVARWTRDGLPLPEDAAKMADSHGAVSGG